VDLQFLQIYTTHLSQARQDNPFPSAISVIFLVYFATQCKFSHIKSRRSNDRKRSHRQKETVL